MKLKYKTISDQKQQSFFVERSDLPVLEDNWHYHEEYELIYILKGTGVRIVGDNLSYFKEQELVLVGKKLPHLWKNDINEANELDADVIIVKFDDKFNGYNLFYFPEFKEIKRLLSLSKKGVVFKSDTIKSVHKSLIELPDLEGADKVIRLLHILNLLSKKVGYTTIIDTEFTPPATENEENRLSKIINYMSNNFTKPISLDEIADEAAMTTNSLCRFFKNKTNKTVLQFVNEFRVGKASQMLINGNHTISQICYDSGFNSLTSFNRVFKSYKKTTPREFKKKYKALSAVY